MKRNQARSVRTMICGAVLGLVALASVSTASQAETGSVRVVFTKGGFIVGVGGGHGVLTFRGRHYPFDVSGMSLGFTIGASTTQLGGRALNIRSRGDLPGSSSSVAAGGALAPRAFPSIPNTPRP